MINTQKISLVLFWAVSVTACNYAKERQDANKANEKNISQNKISINKTSNISSSNKINSLSSIYHDSCTIGFKGGTLFHVCFDNKKVDFFFSPQCLFSFDLKLMSDTLFVKWGTENNNCTYDTGIRNSYGIKNKPLNGEIFATITMLNDSSLSIHYYNQKWIDRFNKENNDTLFPKLLYIKRN